ncbi:EAL domain-containing protein [Sulfurimonas sp.]|nr:EAL domain-containing protein [Sulfurimonas sp.]
MAKMKFAKKREVDTTILKSFKILVVDDDTSIQEITNMSLNAMDFSEFKLEILNAYDSIEAAQILHDNPDIALALIDVVMETPEAGLQLVNYIRKNLNNELIRLVIRTGQANEFPEIDVIRQYDINDFKNKTELTMERLYTTVRTSVKQYEQLVQLQNKYEETYKQMTTNPLTLLPNRVKLYTDCNNLDDKTLILIDIVGFSGINENNGYATGDFVLQELARFLDTKYSNNFNVYHLDNDLFAMMLSNPNMQNIIEIVEKIKYDISQFKILKNNFNQSLDTTIGVARESESNLMRKAELALKEARNTGKNKIQYYSDDLQVIKKLKDTNLWAPIIRDALTNGNILSYYQPIYNLDSNKIEKYEILVRLLHEGKVHTPFAFLEAARHTGQLYDIFKCMFENACKQAKKTGYQFSINIGDSEFEHDDIVDFIKKSLQEYDINPKLLSLEILEYNSIGENTKILEKIAQIHELGIQIVIDDFGVNCSNFGQIQNLPIDIIKIDGSFIENLPVSTDSQIIIKTIQTYAKEKNIQLVAEFVSDATVLEFVQKLGIEYGQGFHLAMPSEEVKL